MWCFGPESFPEIPRWITQHPNLDTATLRDLYNRTSIFVISSEVEGLGLSGLEAMACGAALVSTRNGGVDAYADSRSALLCAPRQPAMLTSALRLLLDDDEQRWQLAATGAVRAACFTWSATADAFEAFLVRHAHPPIGVSQ
ncbi:MAG: glycosyltransferase family 4 protein [Pseudonocardia sp.]